MTAFILAGALGVIAIIVFLLFRQLRRLSWQLTQQRVERDSETILQAIGLRPEQEPHLAAHTADATLRTRHLSLMHGGVLAAALFRLRDLSLTRRYALVAGGTVATIAIAVVTLLLAISSGATPLGAEHSPPPVATAPESGAVSPEPMRSSDGSPDDQASDPADAHVTGIDGSELVMETTPVSVRSPQGWSSGHAPPSSSAPPENPSQPTPPGSSVPAPSETPSGADPPLANLCVGTPLLELRLCLGLDH